jgi:choline dehydrogenase
MSKHAEAQSIGKSSATKMTRRSLLQTARAGGVASVAAYLGIAGDVSALAQVAGRSATTAGGQMAQQSAPSKPPIDMRSTKGSSVSDELAARIHANQQKLAAELKPHYDFIVCGSGSSGSVVARRLAENIEVNVLLLEAGGSDDVANIMNAAAWPTLRGGEQDWSFKATSNPRLNGRSIPMSMGKVLGGGSSINVMVWSRGHKKDWDQFAADVGDDGWGYQSVLRIYRRIEDWHGSPDAARRGEGGPLFVQPAPNPNPLAAAGLEAFAAAGIPTFNDQNGVMMEGDGGGAISNVCIRDGKRQSVFRAYVYPYMDRSNLTVLTGALVTHLTFEGNAVTGVEFLREGKLHRVGAVREVVLSLGAIHTPKLLMQSGIGDEAELKRFGIPIIQHLSGVGRNFQDHFMAPCVWEALEPIERRNNLAEATVMWKSTTSLDRPNLQSFIIEAPYTSPQAARVPPPPNSWSLTTAVLRTASRGRLRLTGSDPRDPIDIDANFLDEPADLKALKACVEFCRAIGNSAQLRLFAKREILPGPLKGAELEAFIRNATVSHSHETCTAKMGRDAMSVVDHRLKVYGIDHLRIADGSITPRIMTGNTMAPCVVIGERAGEILKADHNV